MNGIPLINGTEYSWGDIVFSIAGTPVIGITGIEYNDEQEVTGFIDWTGAIPSVFPSVVVVAAYK